MIKILDLFSGIGGFALAARNVFGSKIQHTAFYEPNNQCKTILTHHFPNVPIRDDIRKFNTNDSAEIICGGDPCPVRSRARVISGISKHPDLSGYFLSIIGRTKPKWVVRENVPASDDVDFYTALEYLGYRTIIIRTNALPYTSQNRIRDIIVGCIEDAATTRFRNEIERHSSERDNKEKYKEKATYPCLTTRYNRYSPDDGYIWDGSGKFRIADSIERTRLAGFPENWLKGLSKTAIARVTGNAVVPAVIEPIFNAIKISEGIWD